MLPSNVSFEINKLLNISKFQEMNCILLKITNIIKSRFDKNQLTALFYIKKNYVTCQLIYYYY